MNLCKIKKKYRLGEGMGCVVSTVRQLEDAISDSVRDPATTPFKLDNNKSNCLAREYDSCYDAKLVKQIEFWTWRENLTEQKDAVSTWIQEAVRDHDQIGIHGALEWCRDDKETMLTNIIAPVSMSETLGLVEVVSWYYPPNANITNPSLSITEAKDQFKQKPHTDPSFRSFPLDTYRNAFDRLQIWQNLLFQVRQILLKHTQTSDIAIDIITEYCTQAPANSTDDPSRISFFFFVVVIFFKTQEQKKQKKKHTYLFCVCVC